MNKLTKKQLIRIIFLLTLVGVLIALPSLGEDSDSENLTLASLEADILADNISVARSELAVDLYEEELRVAKNDKIKVEGAGLDEDMTKRYYVREAEMNLYIAEKDLEDTKQAEILSGVEMYYDYLLLVKEISYQNKTMLRLENELNAINKKIELGLTTNKEKVSKELEISKAVYALNQLKDEKESLFLDLNILLGQSLQTTLVIEDVTIPFEKYEVEDLASDIALVLETNQGIWKLSKQNDLDEIELDILDKFNFSRVYNDAIDSLEARVKQTALDIPDKKLSLEYDVRSKYNNVLNSYDTVIIKELELENLQMTLDILAKRFEVGFETQNTLDVASEDVDAGTLALLQAKLDYYVAVESYKNFIN